MITKREVAFLSNHNGLPSNISMIEIVPAKVFQVVILKVIVVEYGIVVSVVVIIRQQVGTVRVFGPADAVIGVRDKAKAAFKKVSQMLSLLL